MQRARFIREGAICYYGTYRLAIQLHYLLGIAI
jgi:hypothetical protein